MASVAVAYELHLVAVDVEAPIQTRLMKVQACTDKEAETLGKGIAEQLGFKLFKVRCLERGV